MRSRLLLLALASALVAACSSTAPTLPADFGTAAFDGTTPADTTAKGPHGSGTGG